MAENHLCLSLVARTLGLLEPVPQPPPKMKKLFGAIFIATTMALMSMCSTSSTSEESEFTEIILGNDKVAIDATSMEKELLDLVNAHRASLGKTALGNSAVSYKYAEEHNNYMISKNKLSHDNFDSRASKIAEETNAIEVSENVARYYTTAELTLGRMAKQQYTQKSVGRKLYPYHFECSTGQRWKALLYPDFHYSGIINLIY